MTNPPKSKPRSALFFASAAQAALVVGACVAVRSRRIPLGVPGEWEWLRVVNPAEFWPLFFGGLTVAGYAGFVAAGRRSLERGAGRGLRAAWLAGLLVASTVVQAMVQEGAPSGYGLAKWAIALPNPGANGYFTLAHERRSDFDKFLAAYPEWIKTQGSLHIGTHPPGLFAASRAALWATETFPKLVRRIDGFTPESIRRAHRVTIHLYGAALVEQTALTLIGAVTLLLCAATVAPLYALARRTLAPADAWSCAACWPVVPAALMFQPAADAAFPFLAACALALAAGSAARLGLAVACGAVLGVGMQGSLVFLPVGLIVAISVLGDRETTPRRRWTRFFAVGAGFLAATFAFWWMFSANPFLIWWANQRNHAGFYQQFPRSYLAWLVETPFEVAVAVGLPAAVWIVLGARKAPREAVATAAVLAVLLLSGRSLSEVARLWLPFFPLLLPAVGTGMRRAGAGAGSLAWTVAATGVQTLWLQTLMQVVYPV